jgi:hypothetical protein
LLVDLGKDGKGWMVGYGWGEKLNAPRDNDGGRQSENEQIEEGELPWMSGEEQAATDHSGDD